MAGNCDRWARGHLERVAGSNCDGGWRGGRYDGTEAGGGTEAGIGAEGVVSRVWSRGCSLAQRVFSGAEKSLEKSVSAVENCLFR